jgi:hypothetical protein
MRRHRSLSTSLLCLPLSLLIGGCVLSDKQIGDDGSDGDTSSGDGDSGDGGGSGWAVHNIPVQPSKEVDLLFVIDNSGSMAAKQAILANNVASFIEVLEADDVAADYRIGVTTTDTGNPWCPGTTPERGRLVMSSCMTRLDDFLFGNDGDAREVACLDICGLSEADLEVLPTVTELDPSPAPRPWLERRAGVLNLPVGTGASDAFRCLMPQGINGCGFESPLEAMSLALTRAVNPSQDSYGFVREGALLAVVFLTDEADCSAADLGIFEAEGGKAFWSDPESTFPSSAVCWNAGVECSGDPSGYDGCEPVNKAIDGAVGVADADAVLHPVTRYIDLLAGIEADKQKLDSSNRVVVSAIVGVDSAGAAHYAASPDSAFQADFGIGPGCEVDNPTEPDIQTSAIPPVRLRALVDRFTPGALHSVCDTDYSPALDAVADQIRDQLTPGCFSACAADADPNTALLEPTCMLEQTSAQLGTSAVPECLRDASGYVLDLVSGNHAMPDPSVDRCYALRVDVAGLTSDPLDDLDPSCVDGGTNLQFVIVQRPNVTTPPGLSIQARCAITDLDACG